EQPRRRPAIPGYHAKAGTGRRGGARRRRQGAVTGGAAPARIIGHPTGHRESSSNASRAHFSGISAGLHCRGRSRPDGPAWGTRTVRLRRWGAAQSKVRQAELKLKEAQVELSVAQRQLLANLNSFYGEAQLAAAQLDSLRRSAALAADSLRLTILRYQAGEAT